MPKRVQLQMSRSSHTDIGLDTEEIDTNDMGDCVTVVVYASSGIRAQHCLGGVEAAVPDVFSLASGDGTARAVFVGGSITDYVRDRCADALADNGLDIPYAVIHRSRAIIDLGALARAEDAEGIASAVNEYSAGMPSKKGTNCCVIL